MKNPVSALKEYLESSGNGDSPAVYQFSEYRDGFICVASALGKESSSDSWPRKKMAKNQAAEILLDRLINPLAEDLVSLENTHEYKQSMIDWHLNEAQRFLTECRDM